MIFNPKTYTVESVTSGHPDKICDQISDAILDECLRQDPNSRVAVETFGGHGTLVVGGEVTTRAKVDYAAVAKKIYKDIGYKEKLKVIVNIVAQSPDISMGVDTGGAGDQGCLKKGTLVRTHRGFIPIQDVQVADYVTTPFGWRKVLRSIPTGHKKIIEVQCKNGMSLECTPDHKILCYSRQGSTYWKEAAKLLSNEYVCLIKPGVNTNETYLSSKVPRALFYGRYNHKIYGPEQIIFDDGIAYIAGELIGDGYIKRANFMELSFGTNSGHAQEVYALCSSYMPDQWRMLKNQRSLSLKIDSVLVRKHFENFGLTYSKAPEKVTPAAVFFSPQEVITSYLRGLFDSDGTIVIKTGRRKENIRIRLGSSSLRLLRETQLILQDLGIKSVILVNMRKGAKVGRLGKNGKVYLSKHPHYVLSIVGFESYIKFCREIGFNDKTKQKRAQAYLASARLKPKNSRGIYLIPHPRKNEMIDESKINKELPFAVNVIKAIIDRGEEAEVYDLEVEDVHMFSGNGFFVHNSMYGYATNETPEFMPKAVVLVHKLAEGLEKLRKENRNFSWLGPDGKTQITVNKGKIETVLVSCQHSDKVGQGFIKKELTNHLIKPMIGNLKGVQVLVNPTGKFVIGGFASDTGLTGRKIMVDTYCGLVPHGGGCFSGKDPTKVDRSGAYMARYAAKNLVANGFAKKCLVSVAYAIGKAEPLMVEATDENGRSVSRCLKKFDFRPKSIIERLNLRNPIYFKTAAYGHFGKNGLPWEEIT